MGKKTQNNEYLSTAELAKILGISRVAVFNRIKKGLIPAIQVGRSYLVPREFVNNIKGENTSDSSQIDKLEIQNGVKKVVEEYGETLKLLGKE